MKRLSTFFVLAILTPLYVIADPFTVTAILNAPLHIASRSLALNGFADRTEAQHSLGKIISAILQGDTAYIEQITGTLEHAPLRIPEPRQSSLRQTIKGFIVDNLRTTQHTLIKNLPSAYLPIVKMLLTAWTTTHNKIRSQKTWEAHEETKILKTPLVRIAHKNAVDKVIKLILALYSPIVHRCDRMQALFILNHIHLLGKKERLLTAFIARTNRHYFTKEGLLRRYDPSCTNNKEPKRIRELVRFLRLICTTQKEYIDYLQEGLNQGITELTWELQEDRIKELKQEGSFWKYTTGMIGQLTGWQVQSWGKVDPALIRSRTANRNFVQLMELCEADNLHDLDVLQQIKALINAHTGNTSAMMEQYYHDARSRHTRGRQ